METPSPKGASVESVNDDVPPSTGRKGKRYLASDDDLQPTSKKIYNLRNRKSKFSEEEVATFTPLSNRKAGKRLAESDSGSKVPSKKSYYSRKKTSTLLEEEVSKEEKLNVGGAIEDIKEILKMTINIEDSKEELGIQKGTESTDGKKLQNMAETMEPSVKACALNDEVSNKKEQSVAEEIEEEQSVAGEIEIMKESLDSAANITFEETKEELEIQKGTESTDGKNLQNMVETMEPSAKVSNKEKQTVAEKIEDMKEKVSNEEEQSVAGEIENTKESLDSATNITFEETKEEMVSTKEEQSVAEEIEDMKESLDSATNIIFNKTKKELLPNKEEQSVTEEIEDMKEKVSNEEEQSVAKTIEDVKLSLDSAPNITFEETKEELVSNKVEQSVAEEIEDTKEKVSNEEKLSVAEEIEDTKESLDSAISITFEEIKEELVSNKEEQSVAEEIEDMKEKVSNEEEKSVAEEIEEMKESLDSARNISLDENKKGLVSQEVIKNLDWEVGNGNTILVKCTRSFVEKSAVELDSKEIKEYINEETTDMEKPAAEVNIQMIAEEANKYLGPQEETKDIDEEAEHMNVPGDEVKGELASHEGSGDEEMEDAVELWEVTRSGCTTDSQEITEDDIISANETLEANKTICVEEDKSFAPVPEIPISTRSKILFMGNLPYCIDRQNVLNFFEDVGSVIDIRMAKNADGSMKGFCHVTFATAAAALKALEKNGEMFHNRNVKLDLAENLRNKHVLHSTVLVRGLERSQSEENIRKSLMKHFEGCGSIINIHVPKDIQAGETKRVAFIKFEDSEAVSKAVKLCGSELGNSKLFVKKVGQSRFRRKSSNAKRRNSRRLVCLGILNLKLINFKREK